MTPFMLDNRFFTTQSNSGNGEVSSETIFHYHQDADLVYADYSGGEIVKGHLLGKVIDSERLEFVYHHLNRQGEIMTGRCTSYPETGEDGLLRLKEYWQWTCRDFSEGESVIVEIHM